MDYYSGCLPGNIISKSAISKCSYYRASWYKEWEIEPVHNSWRKTLMFPINKTQWKMLLHASSYALNILEVNVWKVMSFFVLKVNLIRNGILNINVLPIKILFRLFPSILHFWLIIFFIICNKSDNLRIARKLSSFAT